MKLFFGLILILAVGACTKKEGKSEATYFQVKRGAFVGKLGWRGIVRSANRLEVRAERRLKIKKISAKNFETVHKGQLLLEIDRSESEAKQVELADRMKTLKLEEGAARTKYEHSARTLERKRTLYNKGIIAQKEFEEANREYKLAETEMKSKALDMEKAAREIGEIGDQMKSMNYYSSLEGTISGLITNEVLGQDIQPGQLLYVLSDPSSLALWIQVEEGNIHRVGVGTVANVSLDAFAGEKFSGKVTTIGTSGTSGGEGAGRVKTYEVGIAFSNQKPGVREGFTGDATIVYAEKEQALSIPLSALRYMDGKDYVAVAAGPRSAASARQVEVGLKTDQEAEVLSGLTENEYVAIEP